MQQAEGFDPVPGRVEEMGHGIRRILAPNPSPMTHRGTNTYLIGQTRLAVIDPGPASPAHLRAILAAVRPGQQISHIFVTHAHLDHSPLARPLSEATGAPVLAYGPASAGRSAAMAELAATGLAGGGEGVDQGFVPDMTLADGDSVAESDWRLTAHWTPGHFGNHLCFAMEDVVFTGDLVMGWASSLVSPPDGDLGDFMTSCARLQRLDARMFHSGHGAPVTTPQARLDWLIAHRKAREASIIASLSSAPGTAADLAARIYTDTPAALLPAAARNVLAHLIDLHGKNIASPHGSLAADAVFRLRG